VTRIICGVDISSTSLAARIGRSGAQGSFANTSEGIASLAAFCRHHHVEVVAMEATGGYEQRPFAQLWEQGLPVALLNPRAVRSFAQAMGLLEKTDAIDAGVIAWFAEARNSLPNQPAAANQLRLRGLVTRLRQLTAIRTAQRNQSRLITDPTAPASPQPVNRPRSSASLSPISCSSASTQKPEMSAVNSWQHHNS
jgi:transposase